MTKKKLSGQNSIAGKISKFIFLLHEYLVVYLVVWESHGIPPINFQEPNKNKQTPSAKILKYQVFQENY